MEDRMGDYYSPSSLKHRLKHTLCGCFKYNNNPHQHHPLHNHPFHNDSPTSHHHHQHRTLTRSSSGGSTMIRQSKSDEFNLKGKCRHLITRISTPRHGGGNGGHHRKSKSTDFRYDPHSYSLNFDEGLHEDDNVIDEFPLRNFSARLPPSPPPQPPPSLIPQLRPVKVDRIGNNVAQPPATSSPREITACS